ncbi:uncharacterized protein LOC143423831 [Xylocopa sonorina]|uniref:uncharacterized protein LOC143423831 n=1 Tax=Xylocopa sonorina TaxID=1818115 RepID=UPI00403AD11C
MNAVTVLLVLAAGLVDGQLNFEGNPLTENTEYTAEESRFFERTAKEEGMATNMTNTVAESSWNLHPLLSSTRNSSQLMNPTETLIIDHSMRQEDSMQSAKQEKIVPTARYLSTNTYSQGTDSSKQAEAALNSFLNSKTPDESRMSLDYYLQSRETPDNAPQATVNQAQLTRQSTGQVNQQSMSSTVNEHLTEQLMQQRQALQAFQVNQPVYNAPVNPADLRVTMPNPMAMTMMQRQQALQSSQSYTTGIQARNDMFYPGSLQRMRRVRGKPFSYAQSRGGPGFYGGPVPPVPFKPKRPPVDVIYTKPPGFHHGPPAISNPPVPYEDASAWFPEADHPPPNKDVYYSQLYAQSYDPHYYNYIAKTGKIKPYLYGKYGKHHEEEGSSIWADLYRGFKKHGLKNMMTPTFLLGMTLPVVTLMLTALVQKRSLSRSDSRELSQEETIQDYLEQVQKAVECYEKKRRKEDTNVEC